MGPELSCPEGSDILPNQKGAYLARWTERQILMSVKCFEVLGETGSDLPGIPKASKTEGAGPSRGCLLWALLHAPWTF